MNNDIKDDLENESNSQIWRTLTQMMIDLPQIKFSSLVNNKRPFNFQMFIGLCAY